MFSVLLPNHHIIQLLIILDKIVNFTTLIGMSVLIQHIQIYNLQKTTIEIGMLVKYGVK